MLGIEKQPINVAFIPEVFSLFGKLPPDKCYNKDVSGGPAAWGTQLYLEEAGKTSLDDDPLVGLPHASFQLVCCHSFLRIQKISVLVALGNTESFLYMREYLKFKGILTKYYETCIYFFGVYCMVNFFLCL